MKPGGIPSKELEDFLELGAIATVGDVMDLQGENRILVKEGLRRLSHTSNKGLSELIRANGLEDGPITAYHVGLCWGHVSRPAEDWIPLHAL